MTRMLVTRPDPDAEESAARLSALGIEPVLAPLLHFEPLAASLPEPRGLAGIVFTSANAVRALKDRDALAPYRSLTAYAVGERTAAAARMAGFTGVRAAAGTGADLVTLLEKLQTPGPLFYPSAEHLSVDLAHALAPSGRLVFTVPVYAMHTARSLPEPVESALSDGTVTSGLFYSRRTAEAFVALTKQLPAAVKKTFAPLCLSANVATPLLAARFHRIALADYPSEEAMMSLALSFTRGQIG